MARILLFASLLMMANPAYACRACAIAVAEVNAPHLFYWCFICGAWMLGQIVLNAQFGVPSPFSRFSLRAVIYIGLPVLLFMLAAPPLLFVVFSILPLSVLVWSVASPAGRATEVRYRRWTWSIATLTLVACAVAVPVAMHLRPEMSDVELMLNYSGTPVERQVFNQLKLNEPGSIDTYRELLQHPPSTWYAQPNAVKRLLEIGDPVIDGPLILQYYSQDEAMRLRGPDDPQEIIDKTQAWMADAGLEDASITTPTQVME